MKIPTLTICQPWASLVAIGAKKIETRSWPTNYRGPLAIHAAKIFPEEAQKLCIELPFRNALHGAGYKYVSQLPRGAIVAICDIIHCVEITEFNARGNAKEKAFGDYTPGRFAWILDDIRPLPDPVPANGRQRLWEWEVPEGVVLP